MDGLHQERMRAYQEISDGFSAETALRNERHQRIDGEAGWIVAERRWLMDAINKRRAKADLSSIDVTIFQNKVENRALGHSDYAHKLCLLSAFLATGDA